MDTELNIPGMEETDYLAALLLKQLRQEITDNELQDLENWKASHPSHSQVFDQVNDGGQLLADLLAMKAIDMEGWWQKISEQVETIKKPVPLYRRWYSYGAAAMVLLIAGALTWQYRTTHHSQQRANEKYMPAAINVLPGGNKATLTLSNGAVINLENAGHGKLAQEGNTNVVKLKEGELKYEQQTYNKQPDQTTWEGWNILGTPYNKLSTPRGGQYTLVLPDGSKVWLNAASSITYPTHFAVNKRRVVITGEAYFDVVPANPKLPFIVAVQSAAGNELARVEVLGTQFNIMAYTEEAAIQTTLVNGKVMVSVPDKTGSYKLLTPGQQAQIPQTETGAAGSEPITVINMEDLDAALGWKNGFFTFKNADIRSIMRTIARWYDVEIEYQGKTPDYPFSGSIPRKESISTLVKILEYEGIHCKLQGNKLVVVP
jgi:ferric-dicitrate binding protein FerR (iron transport regulator)